MTEVPQPPAETTNDDRLWALLSYLLMPLIPIIVLLMEDKKNRPFIKAHAVQALALGIALVVVGTLLALIPIVQCIVPLIWIIPIYYGIKAYRGEYVTIPVITNFVKNQGWA